MRFRISPSTSSSNFLFPPPSRPPPSLSHRRSPPPRGDSLPKLTCCSTLSNGQNRPVSRVLLTIPPRFSARPSAFLRTSWPRRIADCAYLLRSPWKHRGKSALRSRKRYGGSWTRMLDDRYLGIVYTRSGGVLRLEGHFVRWMIRGCVCVSWISVFHRRFGVDVE